MGSHKMRKSMIRQILCALVASSLALAAVPSVAVAQDAFGEKVQQLSKEGTDLYRAGRYEDAARKFEAAYELEPVANLLFNAAKCYEKLEEWDQAIALYKQFTLDSKVDPKAKDVALKQIETLKEVAAIEKRAEENQAAGQTEPDEGEAVVVAAPPAPDYTWSYVALGTGVGLLATGGIFGVLASAEESNFDVAETADERRAARDSGQAYAVTADVLYGLGAAAAITGVILFVTAEGDEPEPTIAVSPIVGPEAVGVGLSGSF